MKKFRKEFKEFALRGSMLDLAIGVIIGGAFTGLINSLVQNVIMPIIGVFAGGIDTSKWVVSLPTLYGGEIDWPLG
ncbi:MAG: MscL family protein, partial [Oscillospiraceae bacterium]